MFGQKCKVVCLLLLSYFLMQDALADAFNPSDFIIPQQQKMLEMEEINREVAEFDDWQKRRDKEEEAKQDKKENDDEVCFLVHTINLENNTLLKQYKIDKITKPYLNQCLSMAKIADLVKDFFNFYVQEGYITTQVYLGKQNLKTGVLNLTVVEGRVENIKFGDDTFGDQVTSMFISPLKPSKILNVKGY